MKDNVQIKKLSFREVHKIIDLIVESSIRKDESTGELIYLGQHRELVTGIVK